MYIVDISKEKNKTHERKKRQKYNTSFLKSKKDFNLQLKEPSHVPGKFYKTPLTLKSDSNSGKLQLIQVKQN